MGAGALITLTLAFALVGFWGLTLWRVARRTAQVRETHPPLGHFIQTHGRKLHLLQEGDGPDLVLIHGASGNMRDFTHDLMGRLAPRYRVTVLDRPGLGYSDPIGRGGDSIFAQADQLVAAITSCGITRPLILGHSYGGAVALAMAVRHPRHAAGLILLAAASHPWTTPLSAYYRILSHPLGQYVAPPLLAAWVPQRVVTANIAQIFAPQPIPPGYVASIGAGLTLCPAVLRANALQRASILNEIHALVPSYDQLDLPVEILHGDQDTTVGLAIHSAPLSQRIAGARLTVMKGVGHAPHHADPATVIAAIDRAAQLAADRAGLR